MALAKLTIVPENALKKPIKVMFNPNSYSISKTVAWNGDASMVMNAPLLRFVGGGSRELSLELFFDVTDSGGSVDVRTQTDRIVQLTRIMRDQQSQRPPLCTIIWGEGQHADFPFRGVVTSLDQRFTLFHEIGHPLRAFLDVRFTEFLSAEVELPKTDGAQQATHTVRPHDTLASIAPDPKKWRDIAGPNRIENPFDLTPGTNLNLTRVV